MSEAFLGQLLLAVVIVLLLVLLVIAVLAVQILLSLRRTIRLLERAAGDVKNFSKAIGRIKLPFLAGSLFKKLAGLTTRNPEDRSGG